MEAVSSVPKGIRGMTLRVTISTITERGVHPQFYGEFSRSYEADDYAAMWRNLAAKAGMMIRIDRREG